MPSWGGCGVAALHAGAGGEHDVAVTHGLADEDNFELEQSSRGERSWAEEVDARGANVAGHESDRKLFGDMVNAAQAQGKLERGARVNAVLRVNADSVRGHAGKATGLLVCAERGQTQRRQRCSVGRGLGNDLWSGGKQGLIPLCIAFGVLRQGQH